MPQTSLPILQKDKMEKEELSSAIEDGVYSGILKVIAVLSLIVLCAMVFIIVVQLISGVITKDVPVSASASVFCDNIEARCSVYEIGKNEDTILFKPKTFCGYEEAEAWFEVIQRYYPNETLVMRCE